MKIIPLFNQLLIKPIERKQVLVGATKSLYEYGTVVSKGPDVSDTISVGDTIAYVVWGIKDLMIDEDKHYFVPEDSRFLLAKLENE